MFRKSLSLSVIVCFFLTTLGPLPQAHADSVLGLPAPGMMINLTPAYVPVIVKGLRVHPDNPILFDFIVDTGNSGLSASDPQLKIESEKLIKYFLASLTIPEDNLWVNLSPYEKDRIIPDQLGQTEMGRDMLAEDYILKQLTSSLIYPEKNLGREFWNKVYAKAQQQYGTSDIPVNTFNKVWIVADKAKVYVHDNTAFVVASHLKVMLEEDYLALSKHGGLPGDMSPKGPCPQAGCQASETLNVKAPQGNHRIASQIVRQIILPQLEQEVNTGKNFANLRQIFHSMILAAWYKKNLKEALLNQVYSNKSKINGVDVSDKTIKEQIYQQYLKAYKKGVFNYIKEDVQNGQAVPRKYFSGGLEVAEALKNEAMTNDFKQFADSPEAQVTGEYVDESVQATDSTDPNEAMVAQDLKGVGLYRGQVNALEKAGVQVEKIEREINDVKHEVHVVKQGVSSLRINVQDLELTDIQIKEIIINKIIPHIPEEEYSAIMKLIDFKQLETARDFIKRKGDFSVLFDPSAQKVTLQDRAMSSPLEDKINAYFEALKNVGDNPLNVMNHFRLAYQNLELGRSIVQAEASEYENPAETEPFRSQLIMLGEQIIVVSRIMRYLLPIIEDGIIPPAEDPAKTKLIKAIEDYFPDDSPYDTGKLNPQIRTTLIGAFDVAVSVAVRNAEEAKRKDKAMMQGEGDLKSTDEPLTLESNRIIKFYIGKGIAVVHEYENSSSLVNENTGEVPSINKGAKPVEGKFAGATVISAYYEGNELKVRSFSEKGVHYTIHEMYDEPSTRSRTDAAMKTVVDLVKEEDVDSLISAFVQAGHRHIKINPTFHNPREELLDSKVLKNMEDYVSVAPENPQITFEFGGTFRTVETDAVQLKRMIFDLLKNTGDVRYALGIMCVMVLNLKDNSEFNKQLPLELVRIELAQELAQTNDHSARDIRWYLEKSGSIQPNYLPDNQQIGILLRDARKLSEAGKAFKVTVVQQSPRWQYRVEADVAMGQASFDDSLKTLGTGEKIVLPIGEGYKFYTGDDNKYGMIGFERKGHIVCSILKSGIPGIPIEYGLGDKIEKSGLEIVVEKDGLHVTNTSGSANYRRDSAMTAEIRELLKEAGRGALIAAGIITAAAVAAHFSKPNVPINAKPGFSQMRKLVNGGIDLNSRHMQMDVSGQNINMRFDPRMIAQFRRGDFSGVRPVIISITPIFNIMPLLGFKANPVQLAKA